MSNHVRIHFKLKGDADGYPPLAAESVWATPGESTELFVLDSIPFFTREATFQDVVLAVREDGALWFQRLVQPSKNSLIRLVFFLPENTSEVRDALSTLGCATEWDSAHKLVAVNIPPQVPLGNVQTYLAEQASAGVLDYEEPILRQ